MNTEKEKINTYNVYREREREETLMEGGAHSGSTRLVAVVAVAMGLCGGEEAHSDGEVDLQWCRVGRVDGC